MTEEKSYSVALGMIHGYRWADLEALLDAEPSLAEAQDCRGETLLMHCARFGGSAKTIRKLGGLGADPNHRAHDYSTALAAAIIGGSRFGLTTLPELKALLEIGADPNIVVEGRLPAVHWAIAQNRPEHARLLLERGARQDIPTSDDPTETAQEVARRMHSDSLLQLLQEYSDPDR